jgi:glyoxylase-like metal-dependent hydrolase (beta-lactamase superfamily II)
MGSQLERKRLSEHVYAAEQSEKGLGWSNSGLVTAGGGLVVDTLYDLRLTREMLDLYAEVHPDAPTRLVNTHHNGDHCWGNQLFPGAEIIAHRGCAERFDGFSPASAEAIRTMADPPEHLRDLHEEMAPFDFSEVVLTPPTHVIDGDLTLDLDGVRVDLLHVGPAHTEGDLIVHLPDEGVVLCGDVLFHRCAPIGWEGSTDRWIEALRRIEGLGAEHVVPGHGPLCGVEGVASARRYQEDVQRAAVDGWKAGRTVLETCADIDLGPFADWDEPWRVAANVHRVYRECEGAGWDDPYDAAQVMTDVRALKGRFAHGS